MISIRAIAIMTVLVGSVCPTPVSAQSTREQNVRLLKSYLAPRSITDLEWELLQFNLWYIGSYDGSNYVTSFPVIFEPKTMRFKATFNVTERRDAQDPKPYFSLSKVQRESILQGPMDALLSMLSSSFPEVKPNPGLVYAEFWFRAPGGGRSVVAKYENGALALME